MSIAKAMLERSDEAPELSPAPKKPNSPKRVLIHALLLWVLTVLLAAFTLLANLAYDILYLFLALLFNLACLLVLLPLFFILYITLMPIKGAYSVAQRFQLESYVKLFGMLLVVIGAIMQLVG